MNALELVMATVNFQKTDRVPVLPQVFGHAAVIRGESISDYVSNGEVMARCQLEAYRRFGYDAVYSFADNSVEAEAIGVTLSYNDNLYPHISAHCLQSLTDIDKLKIPNPRKDGRMPEILKANRILRDQIGNEVLVVGKVLGPITIAGQIFGFEKMLYSIVDDPQGFKAMCDYTTEVAITYGKAIIESGAHVVFLFNPAASPAVIPPAVFAQYELENIRKFFTAMTEAGSLATWLHIVGPTKKILPFYKDAGVNIATIDYEVSVETAIEELSQICINGNIKPYLFVSAKEAEITELAKDLLAKTADRGGFLLSSGCEIPLEAKDENIQALVNTVKG